MPNPQVFVHYFVDSVNGFTAIHFSGSRYDHGKFIKNKSLFNLALIGMQQIPSKDKLWDDTEKVWNVHNDVWINLMPYYSKAPEIYELIPYSLKVQWAYFLTGKSSYSYTPASSSTSQPSYSSMSEAEAAASFFGTQSFNHAVYATATVNNDREELLSLLGLNSWGQLDSLLSDRKAARKLYLNAAMRLHPDRNAGDDSGMSNLNKLWSIYGVSK